MFVSPGARWGRNRKYLAADVGRSTNFSVADNVVVPIVYTTVGVNLLDIWDRSTRFYIPEGYAGWYELMLSVDGWAANNAGQRRVGIRRVTGAQTITIAVQTYISGAAGNDPQMSAAGVTYLEGGDYVDSYAVQNGIGAPLNITAARFALSGHQATR